MPTTTTTYASAAQDAREAAQRTLTCWCGQPAAYRNPCTDATPSTVVCAAHVQDGYAPLTPEERQRQRQQLRQQRTNDVALAVLTYGKGWREGWSEDGDGETGPTGGCQATYRLGQLTLIATGGGTAFLMRQASPYGPEPHVVARVTDPDVCRIVHAASRDHRLPLQAGYHDGVQIVGGGNVLPRTGR